MLPTITEVPSPTEELTPTPDETQSTYKFPNVINLTEDDARAAIQSYDPDALIVISEDYSDEYAAGRVMEQYPVEGSDTLLRSEVRLKISLGVNDFELPNVSAYTEEKALEMLKEKELVTGVEYISSEEVSAGHVVRTDPASGSRVKKVIGLLYL